MRTSRPPAVQIRPAGPCRAGFSVRPEGRSSAGDTAGMGTPRGSGTGSRLPVLIRPMLATPAPLPSAAEDRQWAYEVKWDGVRAVAYLQDGQLRLMSRTDRDITRRYPELGRVSLVIAASRGWRRGRCHRGR
jgi:ATP-dependent DNA ligase